MASASSVKVRGSSLDLQSPATTSPGPIPHSVTPTPPVYVSDAAVVELLADKLDERSDGSAVVASLQNSNISFSDRALVLVNGFLDHLLHQFLAAGKAPTVAALRPAIEHTLKGRLARQAISSAEEELRDLLAAGEEEEELATIDEQAKSGSDAPWDVENIWKRTRLRVMVYIRYGDMEDEDEERLVKAQFSADDPIEKPYLQSSGLVTWTAAIFLTGILEYLAEQCVDVALDAMLERLTLKASNNDHETLNEVAVQDTDVERIAKSTALGRLWRTWKQGLRASRSSSRLVSSPQSLLRERSITSINSSRTMRDQGSMDGHNSIRHLSSVGSISEDSRESSPLREHRGITWVRSQASNTAREAHAQAGSSASDYQPDAVDSRNSSVVSHENAVPQLEDDSGDDFNYENMLLASAPAPLSGMGRDGRSSIGSNSFTPTDSRGNGWAEAENNLDEVPVDAAYAGTLVERLHHGAAVSLPEQMHLPIQSTWTDGEVVPEVTHASAANNSREYSPYVAGERVLTPPQEQPELEAESMLEVMNPTGTRRVRPQSTDSARAWINKITAISPRNMQESHRRLYETKSDGLEDSNVSEEPRQTSSAASTVRPRSPAHLRESPDHDDSNKILADSLTGVPVGPEMNTKVEPSRTGMSSTNIKAPTYGKPLFKIPEAKDLTTRPPADNIKPSVVLGLLPREPRVQTAPMGDLADWVRSTNPEREQEPAAGASKVSTAGSELQANAAQISRPSSTKNEKSVASHKRSGSTRVSSKSVLTKINPNKGAAKVNTAVAPPKMKAVKPHLQPRDAKVRREGTNDLVDFFREGPAGASSETAATTDNATAVRQGSHASGSFLDGSPTSRSGLLMTTGAPRVEQPASPDRSRQVHPTPLASFEKSSDDAAFTVPKTRRRARDPYAIDTDEEDDDFDPIGQPTRRNKGGESLLDFLNSGPPVSSGEVQPAMGNKPSPTSVVAFQTSALAANSEITPPKKSAKFPSTRIKVPTAAYTAGNAKATDRTSSPAAVRRLTLTPPIARALPTSASPHTSPNPNTTTPTAQPKSSLRSPKSNSSIRSSKSQHRLKNASLTSEDAASIAAYQASISTGPARPGSRTSAGLSMPTGTMPPQFQGKGIGIMQPGVTGGAVQQGKWARMGNGLTGTDVWDPLTAESPTVGFKERRGGGGRGTAAAEGGRGSVKGQARGSPRQATLHEEEEMSPVKKVGMMKWMKRMGSGGGGA